jgi:hypothetical protein
MVYLKESLDAIIPIKHGFRKKSPQEAVKIIETVCIEMKAQHVFLQGWK